MTPDAASSHCEERSDEAISFRKSNETYETPYSVLILGERTDRGTGSKRVLWQVQG